MYPRAGGMYTFLRESMSPLMGFLYGWTLFVVIQTGTIAAVAVGFGKFLGVLWPAVTADTYAWFPHHTLHTSDGSAIDLGLSPQRLVALVTIWVLTWINLRGVKQGKFVQTTLTVIKTVSLAALVLLALTVGRKSAGRGRELRRELVCGIAALELAVRGDLRICARRLALLG